MGCVQYCTLQSGTLSESLERSIGNSNKRNQSVNDEMSKIKAMSKESLLSLHNTIASLEGRISRNSQVPPDVCVEDT